MAEILLLHVLLQGSRSLRQRAANCARQRPDARRVWRARRARRRARRAGWRGEANAESADVGTLLGGSAAAISTLPLTRG